MSAQPWVCGACRSVNQPREGRCYRCRTPRDLVEADPETLIVAGAGSRPSDAPVRATGAYEASDGLAFLAQVLLVAAMAAAVLANVMSADLVRWVLDGDAAAVDTSTLTVALIGGFGLALAGGFLVAFALWLSLVVSNVPRVGLGWPNLTPNQVIYETLIPGVNLYRVPAILRDVVNRLEPNGRGEALIAGAWLGLVGGVLLPRLASWGVILFIGAVDEFTAFRTLAHQLGLGLTVAGGIVLIALIQWIETRMANRPSQPVEPAAVASATAAQPPHGPADTLRDAIPASAAGTPPPSTLTHHWTDAIRSSPSGSATPLPPPAQPPTPADRPPGA